MQTMKGALAQRMMQRPPVQPKQHHGGFLSGLESLPGKLVQVHGQGGWGSVLSDVKKMFDPRTKSGALNIAMVMGGGRMGPEGEGLNGEVGFPKVHPSDQAGFLRAAQKAAEELKAGGHMDPAHTRNLGGGHASEMEYEHPSENPFDFNPHGPVNRPGITDSMHLRQRIGSSGRVERGSEAPFYRIGQRTDVTPKELRSHLSDAGFPPGEIENRIETSGGHFRPTIKSEGRTFGENGPKELPHRTNWRNVMPAGIGDFMESQGTRSRSGLYNDNTIPAFEGENPLSELTGQLHGDALDSATRPIGHSAEARARYQQLLLKKMMRSRGRHANN